MVGRRKSSKCRRLLPAHDFRAGAIPNREVVIKPAMQKNCTGVSGAQRPAALAELSPGRRVVFPPTIGGPLARRVRALLNLICVDGVMEGGCNRDPLFVLAPHPNASLGDLGNTASRLGTVSALERPNQWLAPTEW